MDFLRKDSFWLGIILGIIFPLIAFGILYLIGIAIDAGTGKTDVFNQENRSLVSIFVNLIALRFYLLKLKHDLTGRGILTVTFLLAIAYFAIYL
jgi:uncharacterized membrane protein